MNMPQKHLVKQAMKGNQQAFVTIIQQHEKKMYNFSKKYLHSEQDIEDALQEAILSAYKNLHTLKSPEYFSTWLYRILINECQKKWKKDILENQLMENMEKDMSLKGTSGYEQNIGQLVDGLKEIYREPLILYYTVGLSVKEISEVLNVSTSAIKSRLSRGKTILRTTYFKEGSERYGEV
ncbi:sigma-70 family RNA polymerase sigma factor [Enterococcus canis]|uniref:Sigma-70 family RNA polymerase sigma factor n=2 Tax=Enterococcus canis TaxID=214095 RepID=A0A1L8RFC9_9ENTE|nr:sigma-70 family RNA polymerase sigma factor [Enterococcus canis]